MLHTKPDAPYIEVHQAVKSVPWVSVEAPADVPFETGAVILNIQASLGIYDCPDNRFHVGGTDDIGMDEHTGSSRVFDSAWSLVATDGDDLRDNYGGSFAGQDQGCLPGQCPNRRRAQGDLFV